MHFKYPRTSHLPWSPGASSDDLHHSNLSFFERKEVVVTEKMDGENTTFYSDYLHARSLDSRYHPSRAWVKALQAKIGYQIPPHWRICGENMYAQHSIVYQQLPSYFLAFSVWDEKNYCLGWDDSKDFFKRLDLAFPKELYVGPWCEKTIRSLTLDLDKQEGYVVRLAESFSFEAFSKSVAKWVRKNHVQTDKHWMHGDVTANQLKKDVNTDKGGSYE